MTRGLICAAFIAATLFGTTRTLHAQDGDPFIETFRQGVITMSKQTLDVLNSIHSAADADAAEPRVSKIMDNFVVTLNGLAEYVDQGAEASMESLNVMQNDPELQEWNDKVNARIAKLEAEHPDAAARLTEIGNAQSPKVMEAMTNLMQKLMAKSMPEDTPEFDTPDPQINK